MTGDFQTAFWKEATMKRVLLVTAVLAAVALTASVRTAYPEPAASGGGTGTRAGLAAPAGKADDAQAIAALTKNDVPFERDDRGRIRWIEAANGQMNDEIMRRLPGLPLLEWLEIGGGNVTSAGMAHLKGHTAMKRLYVHDVKLSDAALDCLAGFPGLEALSLQNTGITGKGLAHLKARQTLRVLNLGGTAISDDDLAMIASLPNLAVLVVSNTRISGAGLARLQGMKMLNVLNLTNCPLVDSDLQYLTAMPNLALLFVVGCNLSDTAVEDFRKKVHRVAITR
jgi:hypothetical protein